MKRSLHADVTSQLSLALLCVSSSPPSGDEELYSLVDPDDFFTLYVDAGGRGTS